ncbi:MAG TPA: hypothetical protein VK217_02885, partial [Acidimicrobiales bacterium]|nr:hypothetical protein [Acidimicrobiales bacterium]
MRLWLRNENPPELRRAPSFLKAFLRALTVVGLPLLVLAPFASVGGAAPHHGLTPVATALPNSRLTAGATLVGSSSLVSPNGQ